MPIYQEFVPKHSRACNAVAWNPKNQNQLAAGKLELNILKVKGLDKIRGDFSALVWDINYSSPSNENQHK